MKEPQPGETWRLKGTDSTVTVEGFVMVEINDEWVEYVLYERDDDRSPRFARTPYWFSREFEYHIGDNT